MNPFGQCGDDLQKWLNAKAADYVRGYGSGGRFPEDPEFAEKTLTHVRNLARYFWIGDGSPTGRENFAVGIMEHGIQYFGSFRGGEAEYTAWLYVIARNLAADLRHEAAIGSKVQSLDCEKADEVETKLWKQQGQVGTAEMAEIDGQIWVDEMLAKLSPKTACVVRRILDGESQEEIGRELGMKPATIRSIYHRAILKLGETQPRRLGPESERPPGGPRARRRTG